MSIPHEVEQLIERFDRNRDAYLRGQYNEAMVRGEYIDPFFIALGWDVHNTAGYAEAYKDVIHEDAIKVGGVTKAPDYCFRIGPTRKFFVEAKRPAVNIHDDVAPAYQLRRYAWSANLPLSILTDFEEFAVYDCRSRPKQADKSSVGRTVYTTFDQYADRWDEIAAIFSKEAVLQGSFDKYAAGKGKRGTAQVDAEFLKEIESWRDALARNIALRNQGLTVRDLNFAVQRTIDRIIFLRMCEDRGVEKQATLQALLNGVNIYARLQDLFRQADERYNSGLFHFQAEPGRHEPPDTLTPDLTVDDKVLKDIFKALYYPQSPYEFSVLPADILGNVYEQFLGKVIHLTAGHRAKVEEKPEVKKAGGVYYTPKYIVDYIVQHTVGKLLHAQAPVASDNCQLPTVNSQLSTVNSQLALSPQQIGGLTDTYRPSKTRRPLRILDPACGSGSFLIGAYRYLLDYHRDWYLAHEPEKHQQAGRIYQAGGGQWHLATDEKKRILLTNIFGVDIDTQAVEVTKLNLLLAVLENETNESLQRQLALFHERALPDLSDNIKCGNSLIGHDFYAGKQLALFDEDTQYKINAFDWEDEFPEAFRGDNPGFGAVIGNPPYIRIQQMRDTQPGAVDYFGARYRAAGKGNYDIYAVFIEKGLALLNASGRLGYICPHKFFNAKYGQPLRALLAAGGHLGHIVHFGDQQIFHSATTYTCLLFLVRDAASECRVVKVTDLDQWRLTGNGRVGSIPAASLKDTQWNFYVGPGAELFRNLGDHDLTLGDVAHRMAQGIRTSANEVYVLDIISESGDLIMAHSKILDREVKLERAAVSLFLQGREIKPFCVRPSGKLVLMPYRIIRGSAQLIPENELREYFPHTYAYLRENKPYLQRREKGRFRGADWYAYGRQQNIDLMLLPKILVPDIADRASFALDDSGRYAFTSGYGITIDPKCAESTKYVLGLLNSNLLDFYLKRVSTTLRGGFFRYFTQFITQLPVRRLDMSRSEDSVLHDRMVALVDTMVTLHAAPEGATTAHQRTLIERQITATDRQIDKLVYELYGLTEEEIRIVEEATQ